MNPPLTREEKLEGLLLGLAVGDALGLPAEGLSARRIARRWGGNWRMRLCCGRGMLSDDTEHTVMVAQAWLAAPADAEAFRLRLARRLRWWFLALPAGVGLATARACLRLWLGVSPQRSGVFSAGNGPAMRSSILGALCAEDAPRRRDFVAASTRLTHSDPKAEYAARAVAEMAAWQINDNAEDVGAALMGWCPDAEWQGIGRLLLEALTAGWSVGEYAQSLGCKEAVSGYAYHSVPVAIYAVLRHPGSFKEALEAALNCGGDTDTVGAMVGGLMGAKVGRRGIPKEWVDGIADWPCSVAFLKKLAHELALPAGQGRPVPTFWPGTWLRNFGFLLVVLAHGFRRLFPPY